MTNFTKNKEGRFNNDQNRSSRSSNSDVSMFSRDKRSSKSSSEDSGRSHDRSASSYGSKSSAKPRNSYNPNFTADNKLKSSSKPTDFRGNSDNSGRGERSNSGFERRGAFGKKDNDSSFNKFKRGSGSSDRFEKKFDSKPSRGGDDRFEKKFDSKPSRGGDDRFEKKFDSRPSRGGDDRFEKKFDSRPSRGGDDRFEKKFDSRPSRGGDDRFEKKFDTKPSRGGDDRFEKKFDSRPSRGGDDRFEKKFDSRPSRGGDDRFEKKFDSRPSRGGDDRFEKKFDSRPSRGGDDRFEKRSDNKFNKGSENRFEKKVDEKYSSEPRFKKPESTSNYSNNYRPRSKGNQDTQDYPKFPAPQLDGKVRLNKFISTSGICSRREADGLIKSGLVAVNGVVVTELGTKIDPNDEIRFNDNPVKSEKKVYILMNKPKGFVTTIEDPHTDKTVMEIVKDACSERVYPVGRLDRNSVGVLLITNDGDLTKKLTHPSYNKKKVYQVNLDKSITKADMETMTQGITLDDGVAFADEVAFIGESRKDVGVEIHSGRNRIIRRMFEHLGYKVQKLDRVYFAGLTKKNLRRGAWRFLTTQEVTMLKFGEYK